MAQHISMKLDMKQVLISSIEFNFLQPISQQICPSWLPIDKSETVIPAIHHYILYQHTKVPLCVSKANLGLLLQFCFLDAMFTALRLGDKCDRSMTRGKLLDYNPTLFILIFLFLWWPNGLENRRQNWFSERRWFSEQTSYNRYCSKPRLPVVRTVIV